MKCCILLIGSLFFYLYAIAQPGPEVFFPVQMKNYDLELAKDSTNDHARMGRIYINLRQHNTVQVESDVHVLLKRKEAGLIDSTISYARLYEMLGECYKDYVLPNRSITYYTKSLNYDSLKCATRSFNSMVTKQIRLTARYFSMII